MNYLPILMNRDMTPQHLCNYSDSALDSNEAMFTGANEERDTSANYPDMNRKHEPSNHTFTFEQL